MKSLQQEYFVLRTNAIQRKRFENDQVYGHINDDAHVRLLRDNSDDIEINCGATGPPSFVGQSEALQYQLGRAENKIEILNKIYSQHLARPTLDDFSQEETEIKALSTEITQMFAECHHQIKSIRRNTLHCDGSEGIIAKNLITYLSGRLQDATKLFGQGQNDYVKHLKKREEKSAMFFELEDAQEDPLTEALDRQWSRQDQLVLEDNTVFVKQREQEINNILRTIADLNGIFKELATMVTEQGTIIDRIDYNIENTSLKVHDGLQQIKKAAMYQKSDKKMHCIVILAVIVMIELLILVTTKLN